MKFRATDATLH